MHFHRSERGFPRGLLATGGTFDVTAELFPHRRTDLVGEFHQVEVGDATRRGAGSQALGGVLPRLFQQGVSPNPNEEFSG